MSKSLTAPALIVLTGMLVVFFAPAALGGGNSDSSPEGTEQDILDGFRHCVFTVNAYSLIDGEDAADTGRKPKMKRNVGTAFPIDDNGHLLTISCVVKDAEKVTVITDTGVTVNAEVVGSDSAGRISVLKIDPEYVKEVPVAGSISTVAKGSSVFFLGVVPDMEIALTHGMISTVRREDGIFELLGPQAAGTSGTPVLDDDSNVLGILAYTIDTKDIDPDLTKYVVLPYEYAYVLARYIINTARYDVGWLGIAIDLTAAGNGVLVDKVIASSPAATAGVAPGDRIIAFRDAAIASASHFIDMLSGTTPADTVTITLLRGDESYPVTVTMGERPDRVKSK